MKVFRVSTGATYNDLKVNEWPQEAVETNHVKYNMIYGMVIYVEANTEGEAVNKATTILNKATTILNDFIDRQAENQKKKLAALVNKYNN